MKQALFLVTFDAFDSRVANLEEGSKLRSHFPEGMVVRAETDPSRALAQLLGGPSERLGESLAREGYACRGFMASTARGRFQAPGFRDVENVLPTKGRQAADEAIFRVRELLAQSGTERACLWIHLPGPTGRAEATLRAAITRATTRIEWLQSALKKNGLTERSLFAVVGFPASAGQDGVAFLTPHPGARKGVETLRMEDLALELRRRLWNAPR
jgi:hypothetical protein